MKPKSWQLTYVFQLYSMRLSTKRREFVSPFSGKLESVPDDPGMTSQDCCAVEQFLKEHQASPADDDGFRKVHIDSDAQLLLRFGDLSGLGVCRGAGVELYLLTLTDRVLEFLLRLARAGNLAFGSGIGETDMAVIAPVKDKLVHDRWPDAMQIYAVADLRRWLEEVIRSNQSRWQRQS